MKIISYVIDNEKKTLIEDYVAKNAKDFSTNQKEIKSAIENISELFKKYKVNLKIQKTTIKQRTTQQNNAYWLWLTQIIKTLERELVFAPNLIGEPMTWTVNLLHHTVTHDIIFKEYGKVSTTQLNSNEIDFIVDRYVEQFSSIGVELPPFPSEEGLIFEQNYQE